jgi:hypothetical protein
MSDDAHAQANAEQVRLLREALAGTPGPAAQGQGAAEQAAPALASTEPPQVGGLPEAPRPWRPVSESSTRP